MKRRNTLIDDPRLGAGLAVASGVLLWLSFPQSAHSHGFVIWIALVPFFWLGEIGGLFRPIAYAYLTGLVFFGLLLLWVHDFHPLAWPLLVAVAALVFPVYMFGYKLYRRRYIYMNFILAPAWWVALELWRSNGYWGFPWGGLGYSQWDFRVLLQIAAITGVTGISFLIVLVNYALFRLSHCRLLDNRVLTCGIAVLLLLAAALSYGDQVIPDQVRRGGNLRMVIIQPNLPPDLDWRGRYQEYLNRLIGMTDRALADPVMRDRDMAVDPVLVLWPETVIPVPVILAPGQPVRDIYAELWPRVTRRGNLLLTGRPYSRTVDRVMRQDYNGALLYNRQGKLVAWEGKQHLVPFGETLPGIREFDWIAAFGESVNISGYLPVAAKHPLPVAGYRAGVLICFEATFGNLTRELVAAGSDFLINITNDVWSQTAAAHWQHYAMSILRAVENRCWLVRCGNSGVSAIITPYGEQVVTTGIMREEILIEDIRVRVHPPTIYTQYGDWFPWLCTLAGVAVLVRVAVYQRRYYFRRRTPR